MAFLGPGKNCLCCSYRTIELQQFKPLVKSNCYQKVRTGLCCGICNKLLCNECIAELSIALTHKRNDIHNEFDTFVSHIIEFNKTGKIKTPTLFIGHCCIINKQCEEKRKRSISLT